MWLKMIFSVSKLIWKTSLPQSSMIPDEIIILLQTILRVRFFFIKVEFSHSFQVGRFEICTCVKYDTPSLLLLQLPHKWSLTWCGLHWVRSRMSLAGKKGSIFETIHSLRTIFFVAIILRKNIIDWTSFILSLHLLW